MPLASEPVELTLTPVETPLLDEASGDAAVRADPEDPAAFARAIELAVADRDSLVAAGLQHVRTFSWRAVGETFLRAYGEASR